MVNNNYPLHKVSLMYQQVDSSMSSYMQQELVLFKQIDRELTSLYSRFRDFHENGCESLTSHQSDYFVSVMSDFEQMSALRDEIGFSHSLEEYLGLKRSSHVEDLKDQLATCKASYSKHLCDLTQELDTTDSMQNSLYDFLLETYKFFR